MQQVADDSKVYTLDEYIRLDEKGPDKHEFYNGKLIAILGESLLHNQICINLLFVLRSLMNRYFKVYIESVKVNIKGENKYVYPDIAVIKEQPEKDLPYKDYYL